jgi:hypothetical protein
MKNGVLETLKTPPWPRYGTNVFSFGGEFSSFYEDILEK